MGTCGSADHEPAGDAPSSEATSSDGDSPAFEVCVCFNASARAWARSFSRPSGSKAISDVSWSTDVAASMAAAIALSEIEGDAETGGAK